MLVSLKQHRKLALLKDNPFVESPRTTAPLILEINPLRPWTQVPKGLPEHWEIVIFGAKPDYMPDANSLRISAFGTIGNEKRAALTLAFASQEALVPATRCQLIPDESSNAARAADSQPLWFIVARGAFPPVTGHGSLPIVSTVLRGSWDLYFGVPVGVERILPLVRPNEGVEKLSAIDRCAFSGGASTPPRVTIVGCRASGEADFLTASNRFL